MVCVAVRGFNDPCHLPIAGRSRPQCLLPNRLDRMPMPRFLQRLFELLVRTSLVSQIVVGLVAGVVLALAWPAGAASAGLLGTVFVSALKAVAPVLVLVLVIASIANHARGQRTHIRPILVLYLFGTLAAALVAVLASFLFPTSLALAVPADIELTPPEGIGQVLRTLLLQVVDNPVNALITGNFIGILAWAIGLGLAFRHASDATRQVVGDLSAAITRLVRAVIRLAPLGIFGLVAATLAETGLSALADYLRLLAVLVGCMLFMALVANPLIVFAKTRRNPYPLVFTCLRESGI